MARELSGERSRIAPDFLGGGGEMGRLTRAHDWGRTSLGEPSTWPASLKTAVQLTLCSPHPMFIWWGPDLIQFYNDAYSETLGPERHPSALGDVGRDCWAEIWPIIGPQIEQVMGGGGATRNVDQLVPMIRNGVTEQTWWTYAYVPIQDGGDVGGVLVVCSDITGEHLAREALAAANLRIRQDAERLHSHLQQAPGFVAVLRGATHVFEFSNAAYDQLAGGRPLMGRSVLEAFPDVAGQGFFETLDRVYRTGTAHDGVATPIVIDRGSASGPEQRYLDFRYQPLRDAAGEVTGIFVAGYDVTARILAEERQRLLTAEMNHRIKNVFAVVQSVVRLSGRSATSIADFKTTLSERIQAMARTQDVFFASGAEGVAVRHILDSELAPFMQEGERVDFVCADLVAAPNIAANLGLIVHELLTNAVKYGGLSDADGHLSVICEATSEGAVLHWREQTGAIAPSGKKGFGTVLIERLAIDLGGKAILDLTATGMEAKIDFRLR